MVHLRLKSKKVESVRDFERGYRERLKGEISVKKLWNENESYISGVDKAEQVLKKKAKEPEWLAGR